MDRSLQGHLPAKGLTDRLNFSWLRSSGAGKQQHGIGALRLSPSLGLGGDAAQMFQSQHDSLLPPGGLGGTDPYYSLPAGFLIWQGGCGPAARLREGRSLSSTRITTPRAIRSSHRAAKQRNCRGVAKDKPGVHGPASSGEARASLPISLFARFPHSDSKAE